ncbi:MAG: GAF domain-containing sensor histidine kinase [Anaerolineae bacterium]|nr:GAF domain-containing sensor histidine kinase [Anaerolineae bacterium]
MPQPPLGPTDENPAEAELLRRNQELSILNAIAEALNRAVDLREALDQSLGLVADLLGLHAGWVWLLDEDSGEPHVAAQLNLPAGLARYPGRMRGGCLCLDTFRAGDLTGAASVNLLRCSRLQYLTEGTNGLRYHASIPIYAHEKPLGVMNVASADWRELEEEDLRLLYTIGYQMGIAVERARLSERARRLATVEERNRLAREIHDTLAQGLAAIALHLESADALLDVNPLRAQASLRRALELTRANLDEARRSVLDLRARPLQDQTLPAALGALVRAFAEEQGIHVGWRHAGSADTLPARVEAAVYRMAQEALTNIARHAQATRARVELDITDTELRVRVIDNGIGFNPNQECEPGHFGLVGMTERAHLLGGTLDIASAPGRGTRLTIRVPLSDKA